MPGRKPLARPSDIAFAYDGGLMGFYCCVYESVYSGKLPLAIWPEREMQPTLLPVQYVETDREKATRVREALRRKVSERAQEIIETVFLSCLEGKELPMLRFALLAFEEGSRACNMMQHEDVAVLLKAERHLAGEAHLLKGFVRFADVDGNLVATIKPKNFVLPFLAEHFVERYSNENFLIYDRTNRAALMYERGKVQIVPMEESPVFEVSGEEQMYRALWRQFYKTISIKSRENPKCRMTHMPKRYWSEMVEMQEYLENPRDEGGAGTSGSCLPEAVAFSSKPVARIKG